MSGTPDAARLQALVFDGRPSLVETKKGSHPATRVFGANLFVDEIVRAFLRYGTAERYVFFQRDFNEALRDGTTAPEGEHADGRVSTVHPGTIHQLTPLERVALLAFRPHPQNFVPLRKYVGRPWPIVGVVHALSAESIPTLASQLMTRDMCDRDAIVCSTFAARRALEKLLARTASASVYNTSLAPPPPVRLPVIPIGVDADRLHRDRGEARRELDLDEATTVLLCLGRLTPHAKADLGPLLHCFRDLQRKAAGPLLLIIAGDDTRHAMAEELRQHARSLGCGSTVRVLPDVSSETKLRLYAAADIFVAPSDHVQETFGIALAEALCAGMPIVASDWSGFREVVEDGVSGFLVPTCWLPTNGLLELTATPVTWESRNTVLAGMTIVDNEQLCDRLLTLADNPELRKDMAARARRAGRARYDWSNVIPQYERLFTELLHASKGHACETAQERGPWAYDVQDIFSHYPGSVVSVDAEVQLSARGGDWLSARFPLSTLADFAIDETEVEEVLRALSLVPAGRRIQEIVDVMAARRHEMAAVWLVSRLLKYGLLRPVEPRVIAAAARSRD